MITPKEKEKMQLDFKNHGLDYVDRWLKGINLRMYGGSGLPKSYAQERMRLILQRIEDKDYDLDD